MYRTIISSSVLRARSICTRRFASVANGKRQQNPSKKLAMETFKQKIAEEPNDRTDYISILLDCFRSHDTEPSLSAYSFLIRHLLRNRMLAHLSSVFEQLEKEESIDVSEATFVTVIENFGRAGRLRDAVDLFFRMPKLRIPPSVLPLNTLLAILCESEEGLGLVGDALSKAPTMNIRFEEANFTILTDALCRSGKLSVATELLEIMQLHEWDTNAKLYSLVLALLCRPGGFAQVTEFLEKLRNAGAAPDAFEYSHVIG